MDSHVDLVRVAAFVFSLSPASIDASHADASSVSTECGGGAVTMTNYRDAKPGRS